MQTIDETATGTAEATETRRFRVFRFKRGDEAPHVDGFDVLPEMCTFSHDLA